MMSTPEASDAATTSVFAERSRFTSFVPMSPLPPMTTIFIACSHRLTRQGTRQPTARAKGLIDGRRKLRSTAAPQASDDGSSEPTKDRQGQRTFVGIRSEEPWRDCLHKGTTARCGHLGSGDAAVPQVRRSAMRIEDIMCKQVETC